MKYLKYFGLISAAGLILGGCNMTSDNSSTKSSQSTPTVQNETINNTESNYYKGIELPPSPADIFSSRTARKKDGRNPLFPPGEGNM